VTGRVYSKAVESELRDLVEVARQRQVEHRLREFQRLINRWKRGRSAPDETLEEIRRRAADALAPWSDDADPGVPVAHAISAGWLSGDELSDQARQSIDVHITRAEI